MAIVKSLEKALSVLESFSDCEQELGVTEIANKLKMNKSNVSDILQTFVKNGYMEKNEVSQKYYLSVKMLTFSNIVNLHIGYYYAAHDLMEELAEKVNNIVYFSIPHGTDILYLYSSFPKNESKKYPFRPVGGEICPMYCSSMGKAMLAFSQNDIMTQIRNETFTRYTDETITDYDKLEEEIALTRQNGYAFDRGEHQYGVSAVGVPIFDNKNKLIGAMSICGISSSFTDSNIVLYSDLLKRAAYEIGIRLR